MIPMLMAIPCFIASVVLFILALADILDDGYKWIGVIPFAICVAVWIVSNGINEWWYTKNPKRLVAFEQRILQQHFPYYRVLNEQLKIEFERRLSVFRMQKSFHMRGAKRLPGDIQLLVGACAIQLTMGLPRSRELFSKLGVIVLFPQLFITPKMNEQLHAVELDLDEPHDCLLLSINMFVDGITKPSRYYNTGLYGFAKVLRKELKLTDKDIPSKLGRKELLVRLHQMRNFTAGYIFKYTALPDFELFEMCVEQFFMFPKQLNKYLPKVYAYFMNILLQDPMNSQNPVIQLVDL